ncbi:hypothetical protein PR202_ga20872 [Eleusine coracana subsp. coracana]|uniref:Uncharacterized protein n=1 Tax=Eleusine coracana subsp. coracana TaxID=191504 RepID=A0AAV5CZW8_ELECO|nr:hypothetical protein PR202_ga20872 [Eleusine coracana subsp. coracana]
MIYGTRTAALSFPILPPSAPSAPFLFRRRNPSVSPTATRNGELFSPAARLVSPSKPVSLLHLDNPAPRSHTLTPTPEHDEYDALPSTKITIFFSSDYTELEQDQDLGAR